MIANLAQHEDDVHAYCDNVTSGRYLCGKLEIQAVERYLRDLDEGKSKGFYLDKEAACRAINFFPLLRHTQGEYTGKPFHLYPVQKFIVWNMFGWKWIESQLRRFRRALVSKGRGNGKTPIGAGLILYLAGFDMPVMPRSENVLAATKKEQAGIAFEDLVSYVEASPGLSEHVTVLKDSITFRKTGAYINPLSSDGTFSDGKRVHGLLRDEIHAWLPGQHGEFDQKLTTALGKFPQPFDISITTAGNERSAFYKRAVKLAEAVLDPNNPMELEQFFAFICRCDSDDVQISKKKKVQVKGDDGNYKEAEIEVKRKNTILTNPELLEKANPLLRYGIVKQDHLNLLVAEAKFDKSKLQELIRFHANHEVASALKPIDAELWASGNGELPDPVNCRPHFAIDLGWKDDLAALAAVWQIGGVETDKVKPIYRAEVKCYIPAGTERDLSAEPFATWIENGWVEVTNSEWTDTSVIYRDVEKWQTKWGCNTIAADPNNAREFALNCVNKYGIEAFMYQQSCRKFNEPVSLLLKLLSEGRLIHGGNPVLAWAAMNMILKEDAAGHRMPDKENSEEKIDPIVAVLMALSECIFGEQNKPSVYEDRGPLTAGEDPFGEYVADFDDIDQDTFRVDTFDFGGETDNIL